jgi:hypothetical protein
MTRQANELPSLAPSPSRGGRHVELPNQMVGLRTEVPGNGPVGPTVRRLARPLSPAGHRTASVRPHPGSGGDRGVEVEDDKTASQNHDRVRQEGHHAFGSSMRAQTASPPVSLRRSAAGFPIVNGRAGCLPLGPRLATPGSLCCGRRASGSGTRQGQGGKRQGQDPAPVFFVFFSFGQGGCGCVRKLH